MYSTLAIVAMCSASRNHFSAFSEEGKKCHHTVWEKKNCCEFFSFPVLCIANGEKTGNLISCLYNCHRARKTTTFYHLFNGKITCYHSLCLIHFAFYSLCAHRKIIKMHEKYSCYRILLLLYTPQWIWIIWFQYCF